MDENFETPENTESVEINFGKEIAKSLVLSTAISAGVCAGMIAVGLTMNKIDEMKKKRAEKKAAKLETVKDN